MGAGGCDVNPYMPRNASMVLTTAALSLSDIDKDKASAAISIDTAVPVSTGQCLCQARSLSTICLLPTPSALELPLNCPSNVCSAFQQAMHAALQVVTAATGQQKELPSLPCSTL